MPRAMFARQPHVLTIAYAVLRGVEIFQEEEEGKGDAIAALYSSSRIAKTFDEADPLAKDLAALVRSRAIYHEQQSLLVTPKKAG